MPTTYAHWRFGCDCIDALPDSLKQAVNNHRALFDIGVHGPDIFFYDLLHKEIPAYGAKLHHQPAKALFDHFADVYNQYDDGKDAMLSFILGFLSHYALDSQCHCYINTKRDKSNITHNKVEAQYDAHLIIKDGKDPNKTNRAFSLKPDKSTTMIITRFFPFTQKEISRTTKMQRLIISALHSSGNGSRRFKRALMKRLGMNKNADLIVYPQIDPICMDSNLRIDKLKDYALEIYPKLVESLMNRINDGDELIDYFEYDFDPDADENVPVLSYEQELQYIPEFKQ